MLSQRAVNWLKAVGWTEEYRWHDAPYLSEKIRELGHEPNDAALRFSERYGGLQWHRYNHYQPNAGTLMCHTDALCAAESLEPDWLKSGIELAGTSLCPIGADGYGYYHLAMDREGVILGMANDTLEWREFSYSAEDYFNDGSDSLLKELIKPGIFLPLAVRRPRR